MVLFLAKNETLKFQGNFTSSSKG